MNGISLPVRCCNLGEILIEVPTHAQGHVLLRYLPDPLLASLVVVMLAVFAALWTIHTKPP
jgi:hypothetical protein